MSVRICTLGVPLFRHGGLEVGERWLTVEKLDERQRAALRDYHGRFIQVHPDDIEKLGALGLEFRDAGEKLVDVDVRAARKADAKKSESQKSESQKSESQKSESQKSDAQKSDAQKSDAKTGDEKKGS